MSDIQKAGPAAKRKAIAGVFAVAAIGTCTIALFQRKQVQITDWFVANAETISDTTGVVVAVTVVIFVPLLTYAIYLSIAIRMPSCPCAALSTSGSL